MINEDLSTVIDEIRFEEAKLIHEHYFVPLSLCVAISYRFVTSVEPVLVVTSDLLSTILYRLVMRYYI
jgi:hypothetical protein